MNRISRIFMLTAAMFLFAAAAHAKSDQNATFRPVDLVRPMMGTADPGNVRSVTFLPHCYNNDLFPTGTHQISYDEHQRKDGYIF